ncbi:aldo/keto reductase [Apibacter muscae]|uniref:aldo/keto reductase n=1 Tax=Apibacter muscae TaxID=2509004 RepID=UPI0011AD3189|nr:aldo/keto reductase [Apibacter muscae]TWP30112.1 aldo/keto reductase [Apibacter muscae]
MKITDIKGTVNLSNGVKMPYLGLGLYKAEDGQEVINSIHKALDAGYRHLDTATYYFNEEGVGEAIKSTSIAREEIFIATKVWYTEQKYEDTKKAFYSSLNKLGLDYIDLYLIHWPHPDYYLEAWKAMDELYKEGKIKAIGVCNCMQHHLQKIIDLGGTKPMVNQMEFHPNLVQQELLDFCKKNNIQYEAWSPLKRGGLFEAPTLKQIAEKYEKSVAQIILRWDLQKGVVTIPKSTNPERILANADIFNFILTEEEIHTIDSLDNGDRTGAHPDHFLEYFAKKNKS